MSAATLAAMPAATPAPAPLRFADLAALLPPTPITRRFLEKIEEVPAPVPELGACLRWTRSGDRRNYGRFRVEGRLRGAHQWLWEQLNGPVPDGLELHHFCHEAAVNIGACEGGPCEHRRCVIHVKPVTHRTNMLLGNTFQAEQAARDRCTGKWGPHDLRDPANVYTPPDPKRAHERHCKACNRERVAEFRRNQNELKARLARYGEQMSIMF